jgi:hypothetical protein
MKISMDSYDNISLKVLALRILAKSRLDILKRDLITDQENLLAGRPLMKFFMKKKLRR